MSATSASCDAGGNAVDNSGALGRRSRGHVFSSPIARPIAGKPRGQLELALDGGGVEFVLRIPSA